jgi:hypothetical protein
MYVLRLVRPILCYRTRLRTPSVHPFTRCWPCRLRVCCKLWVTHRGQSFLVSKTFEASYQVTYVLAYILGLRFSKTFSNEDCGEPTALLERVLEPGGCPDSFRIVASTLSLQYCHGIARRGEIGLILAKNRNIPKLPSQIRSKADRGWKDSCGHLPSTLSVPPPLVARSSSSTIANGALIS